MDHYVYDETIEVVPYVGTWIEIPKESTLTITAWVVPYVGTWIEISITGQQKKKVQVVPYVGTWIEILPPHCHNHRG